MGFSKTIFVDVDSCLVEVMPRIRQLYDMFYRYEGDSYADPNDNSWNMGLPREDVEDIFASYIFYDTLSPTEDCLNALNRLKDKGYKLIAYSKCSYGNVISKVKMIERECKDLFDEFILISLGLNKSDFDMSDAILIDDSPSNLGSALYNICCQTYGAKGWNEDYDGIILKDWNHFYDMVMVFQNYELNVL